MRHGWLEGCGIALALFTLFAISARPALPASPAPPTTPPTNAEPPSELTGPVVAIVDGDTLSVLVRNAQVRVRLAQIDAPEKGQPYGRAARKALSELAFGKPARVVVVDRDRYGRSVGEVFVDGLHLNEEMVRRGHAWAYTKYARSAAIVELEDEARAAVRGLWALPLEQREPPWLWRRQSSASRQPEPRSGPFACDARRTCSEIASCAEARFALEQCGATELDRNRDGVPCEELCAR